MSRARYITAAQLKRAGACPPACDVFEALFGKGGKVKINSDTAEALSRSVLSPGWAAVKLLTKRQRAVYNKALPGQLDIYSTSESPYTQAKELMKGVKPIATGRTFYAVEDMVEMEYTARLRQARAQAFAVAYNSPKE
jgi:hypothetical protein